MIPGMGNEDGYDHKAGAITDQMILLRYLGEVSDGISELDRYLGSYADYGPPESPPLQWLSDACQHLVDTINALTAAEPDQAQGLSVSAVAQMQALESDVNGIETNLSDPVARSAAVSAQGLTSGAAAILSGVKKALGRGWKRLWSLISHLLTVKEWSVSGQAGTGILGFASATIKVTFG
jgi:hypothetical protein